MIKFYKHSGGSIYDAEIHKFRSITDFLHYLEEEFEPYFEAKDIVIGESVGPDPRIGLKSVRHVMTWRFGAEDYFLKYHVPQCFGFCDLGEKDGV